MTAGAEVRHTPFGGLVCFFGEPSWSDASFVVVAGDDPRLVIYSEDPTRPAPAIIRLVDVTGLDELTEGMDKPALAGFQRLEVQVRRTIVCQAIWPETLTDELISALQATVSTPQTA